MGSIAQAVMSTGSVAMTVTVLPSTMGFVAMPMVVLATMMELMVMPVSVFASVIGHLERGTARSMMRAQVVFSVMIGLTAVVMFWLVVMVAIFVILVMIRGIASTNADTKVTDTARMRCCGTQGACA